MTTDSFYQDLPPLDNFADISDPTKYVAMPDDWYVAISDIEKSTEIIQRGGYKVVNLIGASTIMAILNLKKSFSLPFVFGGDGACVCIPESLLTQTRKALLATRQMANDLYGIHLRVGIVPIRYIREQGYDVLVAPCRLSRTFTQAAFSGGGIQCAEDLIKQGTFALPFATGNDEHEQAQADFTGLECRWNNVPSVHGEIVTFIVQALGDTHETKAAVYREVLQHIHSIYGDDTNCHPLQERLLTMSLSERLLKGESGIRSYGKGFLYRFYYWFKIRYGVLLGKLLMRVKYKTNNLDWGTYKQRLIANTDFKKFDDKLRLVLSGSPAQREQLTAYLEKKFQSKELVYGIHTASSALVTCLLFNYNDAHVHLVDSDNGGYAIAARQLKEKLKQL